MNPENSYVIHGLDADLIFLSLGTGLSDIYLLREANEIDNKDTNTQLMFVNIDKLRTVIPDTMRQFITIKTDKDRLLVDFILLCYLLGNDFLPHLKAIDIGHNAMEIILKVYGEVYSKNTEYLVEKLIINEMILLQIFEKIGEKEETILLEQYQRKKNWRVLLSDPYEREISNIENLNFTINDPIKIGSDNYNAWRERYYAHYWDIDTKEELESFSKKLVYHYLMGIKWVMLYYFDKCPSWTWYYPFEYIAPFINDITLHLKNIKMKDIQFIEGCPTNPHIQLLTVLPPQSKFILPTPLQRLMSSEKSSLIYLYPTSIEHDFIGKTKYYQGNPILPPIDIKLVSHIYRKYEVELSEEDKSITRALPITIIN
jgi:5'-3' exonuclease